MPLVRAQVPPDRVNWAALRPEILQHYRSLVQIDSTAGHETLVVDYLKKVLEAEGIPTQTFALDPKRANLVARLKGNGSKRPLLILAHTDVVGVQREKWPVDPFGAVMKDGYVWGRGSKDDKPVLTANLMTMLLLKRSGVALDRDVIFLAESGEEADLAGVGMNYLMREHFADIDTLQLDDVVPMTQPYPLENVLRDDVIAPGLDRDEVLAAAPDVEDGRFRVPPIIGLDS